LGYKISVKRRHAAALALMGLCLMLPPPKPSVRRECRDQKGHLFEARLSDPDLNAPLQRWLKGRCFANDLGCEEARSVLLGMVEKHLDRMADPKNCPTLEVDMMSAICVSADDPRLNRK
jgi:hypothetical protein